MACAPRLGAFSARSSWTLSLAPVPDAGAAGGRDGDLVRDDERILLCGVDDRASRLYGTGGPDHGTLRGRGPFTGGVGAHDAIYARPRRAAGHRRERGPFGRRTRAA